MYSFRTACTYLLPVIPLWLYGVWIVSFGHDDSHITFWAAQQLADTGELLNYNGERIEQSSSLLFTLWLAFINSTGINVVTAGYISGIVGAHLVVWAAVHWLCQHGSRLTAMLTGCGIACSPYFAAWSLSGMESAAAALCVLLYLFAAFAIHYKCSTARLLTWLSISAALAAVRPEMPIVIALHALMTAIVMRQFKWLVPLIAVAIVILWRLWYFEQIFPNPVYAKAGTEWLGQIIAGIHYVLRLNDHWLLSSSSALLAVSVLLGGFIALFRPQIALSVWLCSSWVAIYAAFVITTGGDWMREGRFWVPLIAPSWLCLALLSQRGHLAKVSPIAVLIPVILLGSYSPYFIKKFNSGIPIWQHSSVKAFASPETSVFELHNREHLRDWPAIRALQQLLRQLPNDQPITMMSKQMGMVAFHIKSEFPHVKLLDTAGLVENSLRNCEPLRQLAGFDWQGLRLNYPVYFEALKAQRVCQQATPDIIYDLFGWGETTPLPQVLAQNGYTAVFIQHGNLEIPGPVRSARELVAVKTHMMQQYKLSTVQGVFSDFPYPAPLITAPLKAD